MKSYTLKKHASGLSLIEMMVATTVAMIMSIFVLTLFSGQIRTFSQVAAKENTGQEVRTATSVISQLLRQAVICRMPKCNIDVPITVQASAPNGKLLTADKTTQIDFTLPLGYAVWPNINQPFNKNLIRLNWSEADEKLTISAAATVGGLAAAAVPLLGNSNLIVTNFDFWPLDNSGVYRANTICDNTGTTGCPYGGYELSITARSNKKDSSYTNQQDPQNDLGLKNYRTTTLRSNVFPRN
jgi:Tfp pilus assembly protein PilW